MMLLDNISINRKARELGFVRGVYKNFCGYSEIITKKGVPHETRTGSV